MAQSGSEHGGPTGQTTPSIEPLVDPHGRVVRDLRVSVTDRCNFRCTYCMPADGLDWLPRSEILTFEEIERVVGICVERFGFSGVRLTGGEPTLRAHIDRLVGRLAAFGIDVAMTTNASTLVTMAPRLKQAGLSRINISLDTLDAAKFARITRRDQLDDVLAGVRAARASGLNPVKINAVIERGVNDDEIVDLARFGRDEHVEVRFIEFMPLDASDAWQRQRVVGQDEILATLSAVWELQPVDARGAAPADRWRYRDRPNLAVGIIPTVTQPFCGDCDRIRLTAEGELRTCLFAVDEFDLRTPLRGGASDTEIAHLIERAVSTKWAGHQIGQVSFVRPPRSMSQIGG